jgi:hypothetical protein
VLWLEWLLLADKQSPIPERWLPSVGCTDMGKASAVPPSVARPRAIPTRWSGPIERTFDRPTLAQRGHSANWPCQSRALKEASFFTAQTQRKSRPTAVTPHHDFLSKTAIATDDLRPGERRPPVDRCRLPKLPATPDPKSARCNAAAVIAPPLRPRGRVATPKCE